MADPLETVPDSKITGRWADEADAEAETQAAATTSEEVALDSLTIEATGKFKPEVFKRLMATGKVKPEVFKLFMTAVSKTIDDSRIQTVTAGDTRYASAKEFEDLNLSPELLKGLYVEMKFEKPSKIQAISLPMILTPPFKNLVAQAHNGSGKTTCFVLGMLSRIDTKRAVPQALCVCPRRELAIQDMEVLLRMGKFTGITSELAIPDKIPVRKRPTITAQVVIGTPGTINSLVTMKKLSMGFMKILVFDEADHMLAEGGFRDESRKMMKTIVQRSSDCQVLLFSATFNDAVRAFVDQTIKGIFNKDYNQMFVKKEELSPASVEQHKVNCPDVVVKEKILELGDGVVGQTTIVVLTRNSTAMLHCSSVEGTTQEDLKQKDPDKIIKESKEGLTSVPVSPDVLAHVFDQVQRGPCNSVDPSMADNTRYRTLEDQIKKLEGRMVEIGESLARQKTEFEKQMLELQNQVSSVQIQMNEMMRLLKMEKQPIKEETSYGRNLVLCFKRLYNGIIGRRRR